MKNKKLSILLVLIITAALVFSACSPEVEEPEPPVESENPEDQEESSEPEEEPVEKVDVRIAGLKGPTSIGMIRLIDEKALNDDKYNVEYMVEGAPDSLLGKIINGEIDIAAVPTNAASILYNKTEGQVKFLALNTLGVIYAVGTEEVDSLDDLEGKEVTISGKGATPEFAFNYLLDQNELTEKVSTEYMLDHSSLAQTVILIDLNEEWEKATKGESVLAMGCLVVNTDFAENNPEFVEEFLSKYEESVNWVNNNYEAAGQLVEKNGILPNAKLAEKAIPNCSIVYEDAQESKDKVEGFLEVLCQFNPASIGGSMPDENFYYKK
jgi:NitT/TauT family transport system substrate-binding protein